MNSIGSAHADRFYARESAPVSTPDRILFIIGNSLERRFRPIARSLVLWDQF